jgi:hypothetical protein
MFTSALLENAIEASSTNTRTTITKCTVAELIPNFTMSPILDLVHLTVAAWFK